MKNCNNCAAGNCRKARKEMTGVVSPPCYVQPETKLFKLPELVSRVDIINPNNPVIQMLKEVI